MNYRHAFHTGNHTEVFKHAALIALVERLQTKPGPIMILDTHAGVGFYDLDSVEAARTGEAASGICSVIDRLGGQASRYAVRVAPYVVSRRYPGSPGLIASMLRPGDRLVACELHPEDSAALRRNFAADGRVSVHLRDGYEAMTALVPPKERRGLVFVDPPFEDRSEADRLAKRLAAAVRKWPTGTFLAWYPVKRHGVREAILDGLSDPLVPNCLYAEFLRFPPDGLRLAGSGLVLVNAPWKFEETLRTIGADLVAAFGHGTSSMVEWVRPPA